MNSERAWMVVALALAGMLVAVAALVCHLRGLREDLREVRTLVLEARW